MRTMSSYTASPIDRVVYGQPAATVVAEESAGLGAERVFLMVSRTLDRETTWVADIRSAACRPTPRAMLCCAPRTRPATRMPI